MLFRRLATTLVELIHPGTKGSKIQGMFELIVGERRKMMAKEAQASVRVRKYRIDFKTATLAESTQYLTLGLISSNWKSTLALSRGPLSPENCRFFINDAVDGQSSARGIVDLLGRRRYVHLPDTSKRWQPHHEFTQAL